MTFAQRIENIPVSELAKVARCTERVAYYWKSGKRTPRPIMQELILERVKQLQPVAK